MKTLQIELPWPPRGLSPNARLNRYAKATLFKATKTSAFVLTKKQMRLAGIDNVAPKGDGIVNLQLILTPPVKRLRDEDNMIANCKATFDGIAQALNVNDHFFHFREQIWNPPKSPGALSILIAWED